MNFDSSAVQPCARWSVRVAVAATRAVARESLPAPRVDGVPACNRWGTTSDAWAQRDLTETVAANYHVDALSDAAAITFTVGYFGASGSSSMAAARSALPVAGLLGATKAVAPVSARATMRDLRIGCALACCMQ